MLERDSLQYGVYLMQFFCNNSKNKSISTRGKEGGVSEVPGTKSVCLMRDEDKSHCTSDSSFCEEDTQIIVH